MRGIIIPVADTLGHRMVCESTGPRSSVLGRAPRVASDLTAPSIVLVHAAHPSTTVSADGSERTPPRKSRKKPRPRDARCPLPALMPPASLLRAAGNMKRRGFLQFLGATGAAALASSCDRIRS